MTVKLCNDALSKLAASIIKPAYDRSTLTPGIIHIGLGNFHRAHQAWYMHRLFQQGLDTDWAIIGAGVRLYDEQMRLKLKEQDYLTTLIQLDPADSRIEICGSMIGYIPVSEGNGELIARMSDPSIRIVSLTVTEGGYFIDPATKEFDPSHPDIRHDAKNPDSPKTAFGAIIAALKIRKEAGGGPFTCQSCDNLQGNGNILRQAIIGLADLSDPKLAEWINTNCSFPNAMVDCIVPATGINELALVNNAGIDDAVPVTHEPFRQWVIEDDFCAGRPNWDRVGVTFSGDVHGYEAQKIRILNAGHQIIANVAELLNIETIADAMQNKNIHSLFHKIQTEDIVPHIVPVPGMTPEQYVDLISQRFSNPKIIDTIHRVAFDGSSRHPGFVIPTIYDGLRSAGSVNGLALVEAIWARMCQGTREDGTTIEPNDPFWDELNDKAIEAKDRPLAWLEMQKIYGGLAHQKRFADLFEHWLTMIYDNGLEATLDEYLHLEKTSVSAVS